MNDRKTFYWAAQGLGWFVYVVLIVLVGFLGGNFSFAVLEAGVVLWFLGILISHNYRNLIVRWGWLQMPIYQVVPRVLIAIVVAALSYFLLQGLWFDFFIEEISPMLNKDWKSSIPIVLNLCFIFLFWSLIYFAVFYFTNYKKQEIENLRIQAARNEMELNNLKAQLNPHFMFNAMNSIRALVDENPAIAKQAVTQLSSLLRSTLMLGKKQQVSLSEEIEVVQNYLALEKIRYEERLNVSFDLDEATLDCMLPPLLVQTLVENAIKHGISVLAAGGHIFIESRKNRQFWEITVRNSGVFESEESKGTGIGLSNARQRLKLMYGRKAKLRISNDHQLVVAKISIPINYET